MDFLQLSLVLLVYFCGVGLCLECYTCAHQDNNKDKCIKTVKQCEENQDVCRTDVSWGIPPYWTPHGDRIHKISKSCDTSARCQEKRYEMRLRCKRDWYDDWDCVECCHGDMCNFYATLGAGHLTFNTLLLLLPTVLSLFLFKSSLL